MKEFAGERLDKEFFNQPTLSVAKKLLGKYLIVNRGRLQVGKITESEAYIGPKDRASHAFFGKTERNESSPSTEDFDGEGFD